MNKFHRAQGSSVCVTISLVPILRDIVCRNEIAKSSNYKTLNLPLWSIFINSTKNFVSKFNVTRGVVH